LDKKELRRGARPNVSGRRRTAFVSLLQLGTATAACALWAALALPGLQLVPGSNSNANAGVAVSLQTALLGIDDGSGHPTPAAVRAALHALGFDVDATSLAPSLLNADAVAQHASLVVQRPPDRRQHPSCDRACPR